MAILDLDGEENARKWSEVSEAEMVEGRSYLASATSEDGTQIFVVGGCLSEKNSSAEVFDLSKRTWTPIASTLTKRDSLGLATFDGGQIYAVGGYDNNQNAYLNSVERYVCMYVCMYVCTKLYDVWEVYY